MTDVLFDCDACGGSVVMATGPGRRREYRPGITLEVPEDHAIPTCASCGETYLTTAEAVALEERLKEAYVACCGQLEESGED